MAAALKASTQAARVRSAFDLPPEQRTAIQKAVNETFSADVHIQFETAPELVSGVELSSSGQKIAWSIADYLATLEKSASALLEKVSQPESKPDTNGKPAARAEGNSVPKAVAKPEPKREPELAATAPKADR
jgi:F-type H+-transporting ATPase subunit b